MDLIINGEMFLGWLALSGYIDNATCGEIKEQAEKCRIVPENPTNKDIMCAFFGQVTLDKCMCIDPEWWNSPYGTGVKESTDETTD